MIIGFTIQFNRIQMIVMMEGCCTEGLRCSFEMDEGKCFYDCNRLYVCSRLQPVDNLVVSNQLALPTFSRRNIKYDMVDWSIILCSNNPKTGKGTGTGHVQLQ